MTTPEPVGVIGGSGFYRLLADPVARPVRTPYGDPSEPPALGELAGRPVVFLPRHGADHRLAPHVVPYRANLWALRSLGVRQVISLSAVGSLHPPVGIGSLVVPDQIIDRTFAREQTFFGDGAGVAHVSFADPYCPRGRAAALTGGTARDGGTLVVINGPRFSTRAESAGHAAAGGLIIGMTAMPEAALARELAMCYATLALVTDLDAGISAGEGVTHAEVLEQFAANLPRLRALLIGTLQHLPATQGDCACGDTSALPPSFRLP